MPAIARLIAGLKGFRLVGLWAGLVCVGATPSAHSAHLAVVLSDDSAPYQEVYDAIRTRVEDHNITASRIYAGAATDAALDARLVVAVGVRAAESVAGLASRSPVLVVLVPKDWYLKSGRQRLIGNAHRAVSALYIDQPYARQAHLISLAFPESKRVGVLVDATQAATVHEDIGKALRKEGLTLVAEVLNPDQKLIEPLERVFIKSDLMLAVPDAEVFNRTTAQSILLTSYRYHDPVVGYSYSLMRAGALVSLYSTPGQIGHQAAEIIVKLFDSARVQLPEPAYPRYFRVGVNQQVARSLGFNMLPESELERRMAGDNDD